ncbi:MAG: hypothetical protein Kow0099_28390 [Candidatus Abyssubacteria bacterium]
MLCTLGKLDERDLQQLKALEQELGKTILAFSCASETKPANVSEDELSRIRGLERKLGLSLVAVEQG